jgi:acyl carrier protein
MEIEKFVQLFAEQFDETDPSVFTPDTHFRDIDEWSSIVALTVINAVIDEYGVQLRGDDIKSSETVKDIFVKLQSRAK